MRLSTRNTGSAGRCKTDAKRSMLRPSGRKTSDARPGGIFSGARIFRLLMILSAFVVAVSGGNPPEDLRTWAIHDPARPRPPAVDPGPAGPSVPAPAGAAVLFDGRDLSRWTAIGGGPAGWKVENGFMEVVKGTGSIRTREEFGDCRLHVEWAAPAEVRGSGQGRGNSGVFLMDRYEIQILDGWENPTYADGMAAAVYGQYPPLVDACRRPGEWQTYDIIFRAPRFDASGGLLSPARMTVFHNGILVQDDVPLTGPTAHKARPPYAVHPEKQPLSLQDHGHPVRFRNIWIRPPS